MTDASDRLVDHDQTEFVRSAMPFAAELGIEVLRSGLDDPDGVTFSRMAWHERLCTMGGTLHGGALMAFADAMGGYVAFRNLPAGATGTSTIESKTNFLRAIRGGHLHGRSTVLHAGRTTIVIDTDLFDDDGRRVGRVTQTQAVLA